MSDLSNLKKGDKLFLIPGKKQSNYNTLQDIKEIEFVEFSYGGYATITVCIVEGSSYNKESYQWRGARDYIQISSSVVTTKDPDNIKDSCSIWW